MIIFLLASCLLIQPILRNYRERWDTNRLETVSCAIIKFKKVENIEWNEIRYVRIAITGLEPEHKTLQIAKMEIVGNEWQEIGIFTPDTSANDQYRSTFSNLSDEDQPQFQVAVINTEDNADYIPPKGVKGEYDQSMRFSQRNNLWY